MFNDKTRLQTVLYDALATDGADMIEGIKREAARVAGGKAEAKAAREDVAEGSDSLWGLVRGLAKSAETSDHAAELDATQVADVVTALITASLAGNPDAVKSVKPYTSTARKIVTAVREKRVNWHQLETKLIVSTEGQPGKEQPVSYSDVRDILKDDGQKQVDALKAQATELLRVIAGRENDVRTAKTRIDDLTAVIAALSPLAQAATSYREQQKQSSKTAAAANSARENGQQVHTGPTVETKAA